MALTPLAPLAALVACASGASPPASTAPGFAPSSSAAPVTSAPPVGSAAPSTSASTSEPASPGAAIVTSPCVLHAGTSRSQKSKSTGVVHASCSFGAECFVAHGVDTPGDGFVAVSCEDTACYCEWSKPYTDDAVREPFSLDAPPGSDTCRTELLRRCMRGMRRPRE